MKANLHTEKKDLTEVDHKLETNNSNVKVEVKDVEKEIQKQNTIQHVEESGQLKKPSGLFILNGHAVPKSMLIWMFIVTMGILFLAMMMTEMKHQFSWLSWLDSMMDPENGLQDWELDFQFQILFGLIIICISIKMFCGSYSKRSKSMYLIFAAMGIFYTIRGTLILMTFYRYSEFKIEELLSLFKNRYSPPHSIEDIKDYFFKLWHGLNWQRVQISAILMVIICLVYLSGLKFMRSLGVDECSLFGRDPEFINDRPRQKFSNWDWSLIIIILGLGGSILPTVLYGTVSSLQALKTFCFGVTFTILSCTVFR